jgi:hypothetical protein
LYPVDFIQFIMAGLVAVVVVVAAAAAATVVVEIGGGPLASQLTTIRAKNAIEMTKFILLIRFKIN